MKQTIEVDMLDGYKFSHKIENIVYDGKKTTLLFWEKEPTKDFGWYVDQYLNQSGVSTCNQISNWFEPEQITHISRNLKTDKFDLVPWEIKIGLFKFICSKLNLTWEMEIKKILNINVDIRLMDILPQELTSELFKTK